jgi:hypothetical protein
MVCSHCGSIGHNKRTCLKSSEATPSEKRAAKALASLLPPPNKMKKVSKPLEGLSGCQNIWKEPKGIYIKKKVSKPLEGLTGCQNIWKEPKGIYIKKKVNRKPLTLGEKCDFQLIPLDAEDLKEASGMIQLSPPRPRPTKSQ